RRRWPFRRLKHSVTARANTKPLSGSLRHDALFFRPENAAGEIFIRVRNSARWAGTLDEMFEAITLIQTRKMTNFPVVIMGSDYWDEILPFIHKMAKAGM